MSDDPGIHSEVMAPSATPAAPKTGIKGFLSTTVGKVVVGCLAGAILLAIIAVVVFIALGSFGQGLFGQATSPTTPVRGSVIATTSTVTPGSGASATGAAAASAVAIPSVLTVTNDDVFTPRDPFIPVILPSPPRIPTAAASTSGGTSSSTGSATKASESTLFLVDIKTTDAGPVAVLDFKGVVHDLAAGGSIPNSPWKVLSINGSAKTVTMLFGDERVTLAVGEGIQSK